MTQYFIPADPATPALPLHCLEERAHRGGYALVSNQFNGTFSLVDRKLGRPIMGYDHVGLATIAFAVDKALLAMSADGRLLH